MRNGLGTNGGEEAGGGWKLAWNGHFFLYLSSHLGLGVELEGL